MKRADELDSLGWAEKPRSQNALDLVTAGANEGDARLVAILAQLVTDGVCNEAGRLLARWDGAQWISLSATQYRDAA